MQDVIDIGLVVLLFALIGSSVFAVQRHYLVHQLRQRIQHMERFLIDGIEVLPSGIEFELKLLRSNEITYLRDRDLASPGITRVVIPHYGYPTAEQWVQLINAQPREAHILGGQIRNQIAAQGLSADFPATRSLMSYSAAARFMAEINDAAVQPAQPTLTDLIAAAYPNEQGWRDLLDSDPLTADFMSLAISRQIGLYGGYSPPAAKASHEAYRRIKPQP
jgi:hypothetical protein